MNNLPLNNTQKINRKEAIKKIGNLSKYAALTSLGTFFILKIHNKKSKNSWVKFFQDILSLMQVYEKN